MEFANITLESSAELDNRFIDVTLEDSSLQDSLCDVTLESTVSVDMPTIVPLQSESWLPNVALDNSIDFLVADAQFSSGPSEVELSTEEEFPSSHITTSTPIKGAQG